MPNLKQIRKSPNEIEDKTITSTWVEIYSDPIQALVGPVRRA